MPDPATAIGFDVFIQHWAGHQLGMRVPPFTKEWFPDREAAERRKAELRGRHTNPGTLICVLPAGSLRQPRGVSRRVREMVAATSDRYRPPQPQGARPMATDYSTEFDPGAGETGPWINWHAAPTRDGLFAPGTWSIRDSAGRAPLNMTAGIVLAWPEAKTGWMRGGGQPGVAPEKHWNARRGKFDKQPGEDWKKALWVPLAYTPHARAVWEQASAAAFMGFADLFQAHAAEFKQNLPNLPLVAFTGHKSVKLGNGMTLVPQFRIIRYVPRPACLTESADDPADTTDQWGAAPAAPARTQPPAAASVVVPPAVTADAWGAEPAAATKPNGAAGGVMQVAGHVVPLPTGPVTDAGGLIDDEIPF